MPSTKPSVNVRLEPGLHAAIVKAAREEGRSVGNFIGHRLREAMGAAVITHVRWPYETQWQWHQGCGCPMCEEEAQRLARLQSGGAQLGQPGVGRP
jgi:hypothetical protein